MFNVSKETPGPNHSKELVIRFYLYLCLMFPIGVLGILGNVTSFLVLRHQSRRHLEVAKYAMLKSLAMADTFYIVAALVMYCPDVIARYKRTNIFGRYFIYASPYIYGFFNFGMLTATWFLVGVSAERAIAVSKPFQAKRILRRRNIHASIICILLISFLLSLPRFFEQTTGLGFDSELSDEGPVPTILTREFFYNKVYMYLYNCTLWSILTVFAPFIILIYCNVRLVKEMGQSELLRKNLAANQSKVSDSKLTKMVVAVIVTFLVCNLPHVLMTLNYIGRTFDEDNVIMSWSWDIDYYVMNVTMLMKVVNSSVNFLIYYTTSKSFRDTLRSACCGCRENKVEESAVYIAGFHCAVYSVSSVTSSRQASYSSRGSR